MVIVVRKLLVQNVSFEQLKDGRSVKDESRGEDMPRSLQRMLELKAAAAKAPTSDVHDTVPERRLGGGHSPLLPKKGGKVRMAGDSSVMQLGQVTKDSKSVGKRGGANLQHTASLKPRKKQFLKEKKIRTKIKAGKVRENNSMEAIKEDVPFGIQADQPIVANLKRKHWAAGDSVASKSDVSPEEVRPKLGVRGSIVKAGQLSSSHGLMVEFYRRKKQGPHKAATMESLKKLVQSNVVNDII
jgi:hypothetical protein